MVVSMELPVYWYNLRSRRMNAGTSMSSAGMAIGAASSASSTGSCSGGSSRNSDDPAFNPLLKSDSIAGAGIGAGAGAVGDGGAFSKTIGSM